MPETASATARSAASRGRLLDAATEAFAAKGFHATTTRDIAAAAGMSPAALYVHHRSKEELLYLISKRGHQLGLELVAEAVESSSDPVEQLAAAIRGFALRHIQDRVISQIVNFEHGALTPEHEAEIAALRKEIDQAFRSILRRGVRSRVFHCNVARTALALLSLNVDLVRWTGQAPWPPEEIADAYADLAVRIACDEPPLARGLGRPRRRRAAPSPPAAEDAALDRASATRARLLAAATQAFSAKGFHATTTRDIAAAAGMSPAAVYVHHKSKEELLYLISYDGHVAVLDLVRSAVASADEPRAQLVALIQAFAAYHVANHDIARIVNYELGSLASDHRSDVEEIRQTIVRETVDLIEAGVRSGAFATPDPALAGRVLLSLGVDISRWYDDDRSPWSATDIAAYVTGPALHIVQATTSE